MARLTNTGLKRSELPWALSRPDIVLSARQRDSCLLCRSPKVNEAGLCGVCHALLDDDEILLARVWINGMTP
ncbi:MAG: hypothetical protein JST30_11570 [Armatimonadetes bacterium]|nr:hypothetical protein [Armatimonadota bacterium]